MAKQDQFQSPLGKVKGLGAARSGTHHHIWQRITALALVPLMVYIFIFALMVARMDVAAIPSFVAHPVNMVLLTLTLICGFAHAVYGLQMVVEDYIHHKLIKLWVLLKVKLGALLFLVIGIYALLRIGL